jgi:hypothetical protein
MIISEAGRFFIATPTKCGTTTLESIAARNMREGEGETLRVLDDPDTGDTRRRQHRMVVPQGHNDWNRYMLVRHPYSRMTSVYEYLLAPANYSQWGAREIQGNAWPGARRGMMVDRAPMDFLSFLRWLEGERVKSASSEMVGARGDTGTSRAYRSPWVWTDSLGESLGYLKAGRAVRSVSLIRLEQLWEDLEWLYRKHELDWDSINTGRLHSNRSTNKRHDDWRDYYSDVKVRRQAEKMGLAEESTGLGYGEIP